MYGNSLNAHNRGGGSSAMYGRSSLLNRLGGGEGDWFGHGPNVSAPFGPDHTEPGYGRGRGYEGEFGMHGSSDAYGRAGFHGRGRSSSPAAGLRASVGSRQGSLSEWREGGGRGFGGHPGRDEREEEAAVRHCVCVCVCACACGVTEGCCLLHTHTHTHTRTHAHTQTSKHARTLECTLAYAHINVLCGLTENMHTHTCMRTLQRKFTHTHTHHTHTHTHTYIHTHTHVHTQTHALNNRYSCSACAPCRTGGGGGYGNCYDGGLGHMRSDSPSDVLRLEDGRGGNVSGQDESMGWTGYGGRPQGGMMMGERQRGGRGRGEDAQGYYQWTHENRQKVCVCVDAVGGWKRDVQSYYQWTHENRQKVCVCMWVGGWLSIVGGCCDWVCKATKSESMTTGERCE